MNTPRTKIQPRIRRRDQGSMGGAWLLAMTLCVATGACEEADAASPAPSNASPAEPLAAVETPAMSGPPTDLTAPSPEDAQFSGVVAEHLPAGGYHYLRVEADGGPSRWVVTMGGTATAGTRVHVESMGSRQDFYSRRLDRRFDEVAFAVVKTMD